jgi:hypothetical protein
LGATAALAANATASATIAAALKEQVDAFNEQVDTTFEQVGTRMNVAEENAAENQKNTLAGIKAVEDNVGKIVEPAIQTVKDSVSALDTSTSAEFTTMNANIAKITQNLLGTTSGFAAETCGKLYIANKQLKSGKYYIISPLDKSINEVWCEVKGSVMVSLGGDGSTKAAAAAGCFAPLLTPGSKWVDSDADAENTGNAVVAKCGAGLEVKYPGISCKSIKIQYPESKNGLYYVVGLGKAFVKAPKRVYCWQQGM